MFSFLKIFVHRAFLINLAAAAVIVGVGLWYSLKILKDYTNHGESITVPDLKDLTFDQVQEQLTNLKLHSTILDSAYVAGKSSLIVLDQDPKPYSKVKEYRTIYLTVNAIKPPQVVMPNLKEGVSLQAATIILESYDLKVGQLIYQPSFDQNAVLDQLIGEEPVEPGTLVTKGTTIDLVLGDGLGDTKVIVPSLIGLTEDEAAFLLKTRGLNMGAVIIDETVTDTLNAIVSKQLPLPTEEAKLNLGESVDIFLTKNTQVNGVDSLPLE